MSSYYHSSFPDLTKKRHLDLLGSLFRRRTLLYKIEVFFFRPDKTFEICLHSATEETGLLYLHKSMAFYPVADKKEIIGYKINLPDLGEIEKLDVVNRSNTSFELKHVQVIKAGCSIN